MSKWRDLICCGKKQRRVNSEVKENVRVHHRGDTMVTLEQMLQYELADKKIVTYVKPRPSHVSIAYSESSSTINR